MPFTASLAAENWYGIYYLSDSPTITINNIFPNANTPIGAHSWTVLNSKGVTVASGTTTPSAATITVASGGVWTSGGTVLPDDYHFYTDTTTGPVAGGGVTTWNVGAQPGSGDQDVEIWWGVVSTPGATDVYVTYAGTEGGSDIVDEYTSSAGTGTGWVQEAEGYQQNATSSTSVPYPSLGAPGAGELYVGAAYTAQSPLAGSTSGFTYSNPGSVSNVMLCDGLDTASGTIAPTAAQTPAGTSVTAGLLMSAGSGNTISHVNQWHLSPGSGVSGQVVAVSPAAAGNILVLRHVQNSGGAPGPFPSGTSQGCLFCVCPGSPSGGGTQLWKPTGTGGAGLTQTSNGNQWMLPAWMGTAQDRAQYQDNSSPAAIATTYAADPCFHGAWLDSARPRTTWVGTTYAGNSIPAWGTFSAAMVTAGLTGWTYEIPSNEPEDAGESQAAIISNYNTARSDIVAQDATAKFMAYCSAGVPEESSFTEFAAVLAGVSEFDACSAHDDNTISNGFDLLTLRRTITLKQAAVQSSSKPNAVFWGTEIGMAGAYQGIYHPRRFASEVTKFLLTREGIAGWRKEFAYFFKTQVASGGGTNPTGFIEQPSGGDGVGGSIRMGGFAAHVMSEALFGTTCSPTSLPAQLNFGPTGSVGDSLFYGLHYTGSARDVVVLATNNIGYTAGETVVLKLPAAPTAVWNGMGQTITATLIPGSVDHYSIPVDDLLTYVFLPASSATPTVVDTGSRVISVHNQQTDYISAAPSLVNEATTHITGLQWGATNADITPATLYTDTTFPATLTASGWATSVTVGAYAIKSTWPWNAIAYNEGGIPIAWTLKGTIGGTPETLASVTNASAVSIAAPTSPCPDTCSRSTYWDHSICWIGTFTPETVTQLELVISIGSYAGEPDAAAAAIAGPLFGVTFVQNIQLSRFSVHAAPATAVGGGGIYW